MKVASSPAAPREGQGGKPPAITLVTPQYLLAARKDGMHGFAAVEVSIAPDGNVSSTSATGSKPLLTRSTERSVVLWRSYLSRKASGATGIIEFRLRAGGPDEWEARALEVVYVPRHHLVQTARPIPYQDSSIREPLRQAGFMSTEPWDIIACEEAFKHLPLP